MFEREGRVAYKGKRCNANRNKNKGVGLTRRNDVMKTDISTREFMSGKEK